MAEPRVVAVDVSGAQRTTNAGGVNDSSGRVLNRDRLCVGALIAFIAAASAYRAATQGIVYDEATTYLMFIAGPLEHVFTRYTANNHVLFTIAANATTGVLGVTEFTLRLPSLVAGFAYMVVATLLAGRISATRLVFLLTLCALTLNPLVFDFLSAARGYGLALCLFTLALLEVSQERPHWTLASLALGGSICANLAFAFPAAALWITASAIALKSATAAVFVRMLLVRFWLPGIAAAALLLAVPLSNATLGTFFFGSENLVDTARSIVRLAVEHHPTWWTNTSFATWIAGALTWAAIITAIAASMASMIRLLRWRRFAQGTRDAHWLLLYGGTLACTVILLTIAHHSAGVLYPKERTGLYFIPLIVLTLAGAAGSARSRMLRWSAIAVLAVLTTTAVEQFTVGSYGHWRYDAGSRRIVELISSRTADAAGLIRVGATEHLYQPALEFYRVTRYPHRLAPVADGFDPTNAGEFDVVVVNAEDGAQVADRCRLVYVDAVSGAEVRECGRTSPSLPKQESPSFQFPGSFLH